MAKPKPRLIITELPGLLGARGLRLSTYKGPGQAQCQGGHALPKGKYVKAYSKSGAFYDMKYCLKCAEFNGWIQWK